MKNFEKYTIIVLAIIISSIINGFVIMKLWAWFVVPTFEANPLRLVEAIGLIFLVNYLKAKRDKEDDKDKFWKQFVINMTFIIFMAGFALLSGWIVQMFM